MHAFYTPWWLFAVLAFALVMIGLALFIAIRYRSKPAPRYPCFWPLAGVVLWLVIWGGLALVTAVAIMYLGGWR